MVNYEFGGGLVWIRPGLPILGGWSQNYRVGSIDCNFVLFFPVEAIDDAVSSSSDDPEVIYLFFKYKKCSCETFRSEIVCSTNYTYYI